ncbi:MAG: hypothetical protein ABEK50_06235, partial [bacterium]
MTDLFSRSNVDVYRYTPIDSIEPGDHCGVQFEDTKSFLPSDGGTLSGEAVEYLTNGEYNGLVETITEEHWVSTDSELPDDSLLDFPPRFQPIKLFLLDGSWG